MTSFSQANVSVGWSKDTIELGSEVDLLLFVQIPNGSKVTEVSGGFLDSIISGFQTIKMRQSDSTRNEDFEFADVEIIDFGKFTLKDDNGVFEEEELDWNGSQNGADLLLSNKFSLRVWDPGQIVANTPSVKLNIQGQIVESKRPFQAELFVRPPLDIEEMEQDSFDISPIKPIIKEPIQLRDFVPYFIGLGIILLSALIYYLFKKYKEKKAAQPVEEIKIVIPAHKIALDKLYNLDEKKLWQSDIKGYQSELTYIIREYLENRYKIPALESTTDEIVKSLKNKDIESSHVSEMKNILQVADLVKFAKGKPSINIHQEFMEKAFEFVRDTQEKIIVTEE